MTTKSICIDNNGQVNGKKKDNKQALSKAQKKEDVPTRNISFSFFRNQCIFV